MVNKSAMVAFASTASPVLLPSTSTFVTGLKCNSNKPCTQLVSITYRTRPTYRPLRMMTSPPPSSSSSTDSGMDDANNTMDTGTRVEETSTLIPGTPCFTRRILASPMTRTDRSIYLQAITKSVDAYLHSILPLPSTTATSKIGQLTLLVPQLNPSVDVYDRRFLLQTTWAVLASTVITHKLRTRVLIQGSRAFGAIPLSIAGLRKHFDADLELSAEDWPQTIRSGDLEDINDLDDDDDIIIIVSPTNAISLPVVESVTDCLKRAKGKPIILINPRLDDVPSHSGVMQVSGRSDRISFLQTIQHIFYLRLLYDPGSSYPLRGILFKSFPENDSFPEKWQVWRSENVDQDYNVILESETQPTVSDISDAFKRDSYNRQKQMMKQTKEDTTSIEIFLQPQFLIPILCVLVLLAAPYIHLNIILPFQTILTASPS